MALQWIQYRNPIAHDDGQLAHSHSSGSGLLVMFRPAWDVQSRKAKSLGQSLSSAIAHSSSSRGDYHVVYQYAIKAHFS